MNSTQISYFMSAAKYLSFTKVAEKHFTTQPTVSRQITALEKELGFSLFERENNVLRLTKSGAIMAFEFRKIRDEMNYAISRAKLVDESIPQSLSVGYFTNLQADRYIYPVLDHFSEIYPNVDIQLSCDTFSVLRNNLAADKFDLIITYNFELPGMQDIRHTKICNVNSGFLYSRKHPLARKKAVNFRDFDGCSFLILQEEESAGRDTELYVICNVLGLKNIRVRRCENIDSLLYQISLGRDVTIVSDALEISRNPEFLHYKYPNTGTLPSLVCAWKRDNQNPVLPQVIECMNRISPP